MLYTWYNMQYNILGIVHFHTRLVGDSPVRSSGRQAPVRPRLIQLDHFTSYHHSSTAGCQETNIP